MDLWALGLHAANSVFQSIASQTKKNRPKEAPLSISIKKTAHKLKKKDESAHQPKVTSKS
jgi:hypothetical protein